MSKNRVIPILERLQDLIAKEEYEIDEASKNLQGINYHMGKANGAIIAYRKVILMIDEFLMLERRRIK